jgi:hypothetical protein
MSNFMEGKAIAMLDYMVTHTLGATRKRVIAALASQECFEFFLRCALSKREATPGRLVTCMHILFVVVSGTIGFFYRLCRVGDDLFRSPSMELPVSADVYIELASLIVRQMQMFQQNADKVHAIVCDGCNGSSSSSNSSNKDDEAARTAAAARHAGFIFLANTVGMAKTVPVDDHEFTFLVHHADFLKDCLIKPAASPDFRLQCHFLRAFVRLGSSVCRYVRRHGLLNVLLQSLTSTMGTFKNKKKSTLTTKSSSSDSCASESDSDSSPSLSCSDMVALLRVLVAISEDEGSRDKVILALGSSGSGYGVKHNVISHEVAANAVSAFGSILLHFVGGTLESSRGKHHKASSVVLEQKVALLDVCLELGSILFFEDVLVQIFMCETIWPRILLLLEAACEKKKPNTAGNTDVDAKKRGTARLVCPRALVAVSNVMRRMGHFLDLSAPAYAKYSDLALETLLPSLLPTVKDSNGGNVGSVVKGDIGECEVELLGVMSVVPLLLGHDKSRISAQGRRGELRPTWRERLLGLQLWFERESECSRDSLQEQKTAKPGAEPLAMCIGPLNAYRSEGRSDPDSVFRKLAMVLLLGKCLGADEISKNCSPRDMAYVALDVLSDPGFGGIEREVSSSNIANVLADFRERFPDSPMPSKQEKEGGLEGFSLPSASTSPLHDDFLALQDGGEDRTDNPLRDGSVDDSPEEASDLWTSGAHRFALAALADWGLESEDASTNADDSDNPSDAPGPGVSGVPPSTTRAADSRQNFGFEGTPGGGAKNTKMDSSRLGERANIPRKNVFLARRELCFNLLTFIIDNRSKPADFVSLTHDAAAAMLSRWYYTQDSVSTSTLLDATRACAHWAGSVQRYICLDLSRLYALYMHHGVSAMATPVLRVLLVATPALTKLDSDEEDMLVLMVLRALQSHRMYDRVLACQMITTVESYHPHIMHRLFSRREVEEQLALLLASENNSPLMVFQYLQACLAATRDINMLPERASPVLGGWGLNWRVRRRLLLSPLMVNLVLDVANRFVDTELSIAIFALCLGLCAGILNSASAEPSLASLVAYLRVVTATVIPRALEVVYRFQTTIDEETPRRSSIIDDLRALDLLDAGAEMALTRSSKELPKNILAEAIDSSVSERNEVATESVTEREAAFASNADTDITEDLGIGEEESLGRESSIGRSAFSARTSGPDMLEVLNGLASTNMAEPGDWDAQYGAQVTSSRIVNAMLPLRARHSSGRTPASKFSDSFHGSPVDSTCNQAYTAPTLALRSPIESFVKTGQQDNEDQTYQCALRTSLRISKAILSVPLPLYEDEEVRRKAETSGESGTPEEVPRLTTDSDFKSRPPTTHVEAAAAAAAESAAQAAQAQASQSSNPTNEKLQAAIEACCYDDVPVLQPPFPLSGPLSGIPKDIFTFPPPAEVSVESMAVQALNLAVQMLTRDKASVDFFCEEGVWYFGKSSLSVRVLQTLNFFPGNRTIAVAGLQILAQLASARVGERVPSEAEHLLEVSSSNATAIHSDTVSISLAGLSLSPVPLSPPFCHKKFLFLFSLSPLCVFFSRRLAE